MSFKIIKKKDKVSKENIGSLYMKALTIREKD